MPGLMQDQGPGQAISDKPMKSATYEFTYLQSLLEIANPRFAFNIKGLSHNITKTAMQKFTDRPGPDFLIKILIFQAFDILIVLILKLKLMVWHRISIYIGYERK